jgi:HK97 family phage prohead protease
MRKKMKQQLEHRSIPCEFRVAKDTGKNTIFGYGAVYGVRSSDLGGWVEVISPGAFDAHLATTPSIKGYFNHDTNLILGSTAAGTMRVKSDKVGLAYEIDAPETQAARDLMVSMQRGDINQSSFGFVCRDASWGYDEVSGLDIRTVKQADVYDCSPVSEPAYPQATSGVRSLPTDMPLEVRTKLNALKPEKRDDPTEDPVDNDPDCECDCAQCEAGSCGLCSNDDCDDEYCSDACKDSRAAHIVSEDNKRWIRIALAKHAHAA